MKFKIRIEPSGHEFTAADDETVLAAALRHGINLPYSCRHGACATCKGRLRAGRVDYGDCEARALSQEEKAAGFALLCRARPATDLVIEAREVTAVDGIIVRTLPCRVVKMDRPAPDVMVLYLKLPQGERLWYLAGQYLDILLRDGRRRSFSIANPPHDDALLELHIRHLPGGVFSGHVFDAMKEKDLLRFQGPFGTFFLREESTRPAILMAGGTGFAPIKAIVEHALHVGIERPLHLYWGARTRRDLYMHALAESWARRHAQFRYTPVLSGEPPANGGHPGDRAPPITECAWSGRIGLVHEALVQDYPDLSGYEIYASGPPPMIEAGRRAFAAHGLAPDQMYCDAFEHAADHADPTPHP